LEPIPRASMDENDMTNILSYVARLMHDESFMVFCNTLESYVADSEDGAQMLRTLARTNDNYNSSTTHNLAFIPSDQKAEE
jgi:hypothetical protein